MRRPQVAAEVAVRLEAASAHDPVEHVRIGLEDRRAPDKPGGDDQIDGERQGEGQPDGPREAWLAVRPQRLVWRAANARRKASRRPSAIAARRAAISCWKKARLCQESSTLPRISSDFTRWCR